jgi:hypothetical protein
LREKRKAFEKNAGATLEGGKNTLIASCRKQNVQQFVVGK